MIYKHHCMMQYCFKSRELPTCSIKHGQQNGGNPCSVTISNAKFPDKFFKEDTNCLRKGIGESCDDKTAKKDSPAPASVRGFNTRWTIISYYSSHDEGQECSLRNKKQLQSNRHWDNYLTKIGRNCTTVKVTNKIWDYFKCRS